MSKVQSSLLVDDEAFAGPAPVHDDVSTPKAPTQGGPGVDGGAVPKKGTLLSRPAAPQGRQSLFRR